MKNLSDKDLQNILSGLLAYKPEKVILFGSAARGNLKTAGDLDLFIIKKTTKSHAERVWEITDLIFDKINAPLDLVVYTPEEVKQAQKNRSMFLEEVFKEGRVLYG